MISTRKELLGRVRAIVVDLQRLDIEVIDGIQNAPRPTGRPHHWLSRADRRLAAAVDTLTELDLELR